MLKHRVNLDALIVREDLEITTSKEEQEPAGGVVANFPVDQLADGQNMFLVLRKPDFQRETSNWTPVQVVELVKNHLDEELVPAIILWKARNRNVFVIDGAHRLSALIAWVNDDYGDKHLSQKFFGYGNIPNAQIVAAKQTRELMEREVGSYDSLRRFIKNPEGGQPIQIKRARNIPSVTIMTQSVTNDAAHAEASFYRINQGGAVIDDSETEIIRSRSRPEALAARALLRAGTGHKYWWRFSDSVRQEIETLSQEIYGLLYKPELEEAYRTFDLPMAGKGYSGNTLAVIFEFIHIANDLPREKPNKKVKKKLEPLPKDDPKRDEDGNATLQYLRQVKDLSEIITSDHEKSLGLHPAVYSYSATGKFQPTAFFAQVELVKRLQKTDGFFEFIELRERFEDFLVKYKYFVNQLIGGHGAMTRGLGSLVDLQKEVLEGIKAGKTDDEIKNAVLSDLKFSSHLREVPKIDASDPDKKGFSTEVKAASRLRTALESAARCPICKARLHANATSVDHVERREEGGSSGHSDNAQLTHPRCNTGYKEWLVHKARKSQHA